MSADKEWFEGRSADPYEKCYWRRVGFAAFVGIVLAMVAGLLHGCAAPETFQGICALKHHGSGEGGVHYFLTYCEAKQ